METTLNVNKFLALSVEERADLVNLTLVGGKEEYRCKVVEEALYQCKNLKKLRIEDSVKFLSKPFFDCGRFEALESIEYAHENGVDLLFKNPILGGWNWQRAKEADSFESIAEDSDFLLKWFRRKLEDNVSTLLDDFSEDSFILLGEALKKLEDNQFDFSPLGPEHKAVLKTIGPSYREEFWTLLQSHSEAQKADGANAKKPVSFAEQRLGDKSFDNLDEALDYLFDHFTQIYFLEIKNALLHSESRRVFLNSILVQDQAQALNNICFPPALRDMLDRLLGVGEKKHVRVSDIHRAQEAGMALAHNDAADCYRQDDAFLRTLTRYYCIGETLFPKTEWGILPIIEEYAYEKPSLMFSPSLSKYLNKKQNVAASLGRFIAAHLRCPQEQEAVMCSAMKARETADAPTSKLLDSIINSLAAHMDRDTPVSCSATEAVFAESRPFLINARRRRASSEKSSQGLEQTAAMPMQIEEIVQEDNKQSAALKHPRLLVSKL